MKNANAMNINELDFVAGGTAKETAKDSFELWEYGFMEDHYGTVGIWIDWATKSRNVDKAWAEAGVDVITSPFEANVYKIKGKQVSRDEALASLKNRPFRDRREI